MCCTCKQECHRALSSSLGAGREKGARRTFEKSFEKYGSCWGDMDHRGPRLDALRKEPCFGSIQLHESWYVVLGEIVERTNAGRSLDDTKCFGKSRGGPATSIQRRVRETMQVPRT